MKLWKILVLCLLVLFLGWGIFNLQREKREMKNEYLKIKEITDRLTEENKKTKEQIEYYKNPENLLKASREQSNLKKEGETMIILVPKTSSSTPQ
ncbi:MAG: septum formation initiator family protein [Candidatus Paceibacterota bacterium]|jgi:cell division protein FtsB